MCLKALNLTVYNIVTMIEQRKVIAEFYQIIIILALNLLTFEFAFSFFTRMQILC